MNAGHDLSSADVQVKESTAQAEASATDATSQRVWTNIYLSFALPREDREVLDAYLRAHDSSMSMRLREVMIATLAEAGVELPKPGVESSRH